MIKHLRLVFVLFHVAAVTVWALPSPAAGLRRSAWDDPTVKAELATWAGWLGQEPAAFTDRLWAFAQGYVEVHRAAKAPFSAYVELAGVEQAWLMFVAPHRWPTRLVLDERRGDGPWTPLFEERSATADWRARTFGVERMRASVFRWGWSSYRKSYQAGCRALAALRFAEDPAVTAVRCRFKKARTPSPEEARTGTAPEGTWVFPYEVTR